MHLPQGSGMHNDLTEEHQMGLHVCHLEQLALMELTLINGATVYTLQKHRGDNCTI